MQGYKPYVEMPIKKLSKDKNVTLCSDRPGEI
jgi:hypothetical protein